MDFGAGSEFGPEVAKRYGEGSEMLGFLDTKRQENGTENTMDSGAVVFLVRKGLLGNTLPLHEKTPTKLCEVEESAFHCANHRVS